MTAIALGLGLGLGLGNQKKTSSDPLAGIPFALRLQSHNFQAGTSQQTVTVSDAPNSNADGGYLLVSGSWITPNNNSTITYDSGTTLWSFAVYDSSGSNVANYTGVGGTGGNPSTVAVWSDIIGPISISVTTQLSPFYAPFGLFQDPACTIPAVNYGDPIGGWKDMFTVGNPVASQSNAMQRPLLQFAPNGSGTWLPVPVFDGVDDILVHTISLGGNPATLFSVVKATNSAFGFVVAAQAPNTPLSAHAISGLVSNASDDWYTFFSAENDSLHKLDTWKTISVVARSGTDIDLVTDGAVVTVVGSGYYTDAVDRRAMGGTGAGQNFAGRITEVIFAPSALAGSDWTRIENYSSGFKPA